MLTKTFFITLFIKQNSHHRYGVLLHTLALVAHIIRARRFKMLLAALLHDIGKPLVAFQDANDIRNDEYSFLNHEEISYQLIKRWPISDYTKNLVRYHYLIRGMSKALEKNNVSRYQRQKRLYDRLDEDFKRDLAFFMCCDDLAKK